MLTTCSTWCNPLAGSDIVAWIVNSVKRWLLTRRYFGMQIASPPLREVLWPDLLARDRGEYNTVCPSNRGALGKLASYRHTTAG